MSSPTPSISIIVVVDEEKKALCMPSLKRQEYHRPYEIILVVGGNRSQAKNVGVFESRAPLIAFIDSDCEAPDKWLATLEISLPNDPLVAGVGGVSSSPSSSNSFERAKRRSSR